VLLVPFKEVDDDELILFSGIVVVEVVVSNDDICAGAINCEGDELSTCSPPLASRRRKLFSRLSCAAVKAGSDRECKVLEVGFKTEIDPKDGRIERDSDLES
jgi:hypothetical protein